MVNELRGGWQWSPNDFFANITRDQFDNQDFYGLVFPNVGNGVTTADADAAAAQHDDVERRELR